MLHPIFSVLISRPDLVVEHLSGYAGLIQEESREVGAELAQRAIAGVLAAVCLLVFLVLAGVAAMLWALMGFHWMLLLAPAVFLVLGLVATVQARRKLPQAAFRELRSQLDADAQTLQALGTPS